MKPKNNPLLRPASLAAIALTLGTAGTLFLDSAQASSQAWDGGASNVDLLDAANWNGNNTSELPTSSGDTATWNGTVAGNLALTYGNAFGPTTSSSQGINLSITNAQTGSLQITSTLANTTGSFQLGSITIDGGGLGAGAFTLGGAANPSRVAFRNTSNIQTLTNNSGNVATFGSNITFFSANAAARTLTFGGSGNWQVDSNLVVSGATVNVTKQDAGTLTLSVANGYGGLTTVTGGALNVGSSGSLKSGNALTVGASGTADFANAGQTLGTVSNANTATNALNFSAATGTVTLASLTGAGNTRFGSNGTVTGGISTGTVNVVGLLTASISGGTVGAGSLSSTAVSGGATTVSGVATIGTMSAGTANLNGSTSAITTLNGGTVNLGSTVLTVSGGTTSGSITGASGALTKSGAGTLTLQSGGTFNYGGATTVTDGKLIVNGNISTSTTTVSGTGTLGGNGTVGAVIVQTGGTLAPGNSIENLNATSASFDGNSTFAVEINSTAETSDRLTLTGGGSITLTINSGALLTLSELGTAGQLELRDRLVLANYFAATGTGWNGGLLTYSGNPLTDGEIFSALGYQFAINYDDTSTAAVSPFGEGDVSDGGDYLTLTVVPEPRAAMLGLIGVLMLLRRRR